MSFKKEYKNNLSRLPFSENFKENTVEMLKETADRKEETIMINKRKPIKVAVLAIAAILVFSISAFAIATLLTPSDVANRFDEKELAMFFEENYFEPVTVKGEEYSVTFMGMAPGEEFFAYGEDEAFVSENRTYAVIAVYRNDGEPLSHLNDSPVQVIPVLDGYRPNVFFAMGMSHQRFSRDGVLYYLWDYTDLEVFADKNVRLMAFEDDFPIGILVSNSKGEIVYSEDYSGFKGVFELELDKSKADPEKAEKLINDFDS